MSFLLRLSSLACAMVLAGIVLCGCRSTDAPPIFTDNPTLPPMSDSPTNDAESATASFHPGETVIVGTTTGSDAGSGPVAAAGQNYLIADDGTITLPLVGKVQAAGKTPSELQDDIDKLYVPQFYVHLTTTVTGAYRVYYVGGEVGHSGPQVYNGHTTLTTAIQAAGDLTPYASHRKIWITHTDGTRIEVNYDRALSDSSQDPPIFPGDKIEVHRRVF